MTTREENGLKKFMVGLGVAIVVQTLVLSGTLVWWAGGMEIRMQHVEKALAACCIKVTNQ